MSAPLAPPALSSASSRSAAVESMTHPDQVVQEILLSYSTEDFVNRAHAPLVARILQFLATFELESKRAMAQAEQMDEQMEYLISLLDQLLFAGKLGTVEFRWAPPEFFIKPHDVGDCSRDLDGNIEIAINPNPPIDSHETAVEVVLGTLLHECSHIPMYRACDGFSSENDHADCKVRVGTKTHGPAWETLARAVEQRAARMLWNGVVTDLGIDESVENEVSSFMPLCTDLQGPGIGHDIWSAVVSVWHNIVGPEA